MHHQAEQRRPASARGDRPADPDYFHGSPYNRRSGGGAPPGGSEYSEYQQYAAADRRAAKSPYAQEKLVIEPLRLDTWGLTTLQVEFSYSAARVVNTDGVGRQDPSSYRAYAQQNYTTQQFNGGDEYRVEARSASWVPESDLYGSGRRSGAYHESRDASAPVAGGALTQRANGRSSSSLYGSERSLSQRSTDLNSSSGGDLSSGAPSSLRSSLHDSGSVQQSPWQSASTTYSNYVDKQRDARNGSETHSDRVAPRAVQESNGARTADEEEVVKLRALLASSNSELSRQINSITAASKTHSAATEDKYQLQLAQKQVVNLEGKLHLSESKAKASHSELEAKFKALQTEHARVLGRQAEKEKWKEPEAFGGVNQSVELIKAKRDAEALRLQYDELSHRHSVLQRSLQLLDEQKSTEMKMLTDVSLKLSDAENEVQRLQSKHSVLLQENEMLNRKMQDELEKKEQHRVQCESEHEAALARAQTVIVSQKTELDAARETQESLKARKRDFEDSVASLKIINQEMSQKEKWLVERLHAQVSRLNLQKCSSRFRLVCPAIHPVPSIQTNPVLLTPIFKPRFEFSIADMC